MRTKMLRILRQLNKCLQKAHPLKTFVNTIMIQKIENKKFQRVSRGDKENHIESKIETIKIVIDKNRKRSQK